MENTELNSLPDARFLRRITAGVYDLFLLFAVAFMYSMIVTLIANALGYEPTGLSLESSGEDMTLSADEEYQPMLSGPLYQLGLYLSLAAFLWVSGVPGMPPWACKPGVCS